LVYGRDTNYSQVFSLNLNGGNSLGYIRKGLTTFNTVFALMIDPANKKVELVKSQRVFGLS